MTTAPRWQGFVAPLVSIAFGAAVAIGGSRYPIGTLTDMGPGFFPTAIGVVIALLGLVIGIGAAVAPPPEPLEPVEWRPLIAVSLSLLAFAMTVETVGFAPATFLQVLISALGGKNVTVWRVIWLSAVLIVGCALIFIWGLGLKVDLIEGLV